MNINKILTNQLIVGESLKTRLQNILQNENLDSQRVLIKTLASELGVDILDCASALLYLNQQTIPPPALPLLEGNTLPEHEPRPKVQPGVKMVRYRLEVGNSHQINVEELKKILVEESGVDKKNINNVEIHNAHTFIELPDEMPHDIFLHLKSVLINQQKLDIKRVKNRGHKKRGNNRSRRVRQRKSKSPNEASEKSYGN